MGHYDTPPKSGNISEEGTGRLHEPEDQDACYGIDFPRDVRETIHMKSHQCGCLNKTRIRMATTDKPTWEGKPHGAPTLDKELQANKEY